jgi:DNA-binding transcriptional regulator/RsmH inhibitor MraZ
LHLYTGEAEASLDEKNRLTIPRKFRRTMQPYSDEAVTVFLLPGNSVCDFMLVGADAFDRLKSVFANDPIPGGAGPNDPRKLLGRCEQVEIDKAGRILVEKGFLERNRVSDRSFVVTGNGPQLEFYGSAKWSRLQEELLTPEFIDQAWESLRNLARQAEPRVVAMAGSGGGV